MRRRIFSRVSESGIRDDICYIHSRTEEAHNNKDDFAVALRMVDEANNERARELGGTFDGCDGGTSQEEVVLEPKDPRRILLQRR